MPQDVLAGSKAFYIYKNEAKITDNFPMKIDKKLFTF